MFYFLFAYLLLFFASCYLTLAPYCLLLSTFYLLLATFKFPIATSCLFVEKVTCLSSLENLLVILGCSLSLILLWIVVATLKSLPYQPGRTRIYQNVLRIIKGLAPSGFLSLSFGAKKVCGSRYVVDIFSCDEQLKKWRCHSVCPCACPFFFFFCILGVCMVFQGCLKGVWSFKDVSGKFKGCFKEVSRVFQESFMGVSTMIDGCFKKF